MDEPGPQGKATIRGLLSDYGLRPNQSYGQNFLIDPNVIRRIVRLSGVSAGSSVVEIGGGTGTLTGAIAATGARVVVYEIDAGLVRVLEDALGGLSNVEIRHEDASEVDLNGALVGGPWSLVANLPYNVGTGILLDALRHAPDIDRFVIMVQREVAERLLAGPGSGAYGIPSVVTTLHASGSVAFTAPPSVFYPTPAVDSTVVELVRHPAPERAERAIEIAIAAFGQRRKMLRRSLAGIIPNTVPVLERCGIDPTLRPEDLSPEDFVAIAAEVES
ncbi:MAG: 16S rRNA (adenine(1518)-N(6)/adenine(1519)-N(6))-dimethyltransferase RsmA [Actinomycetota bacterium]|nr:16S rRNA (adenine(1518)-N(6)/adenine(1519)-N(6))-dimethyltransferase RsmA [Actinomycetota bacterium]